MVPISAPRPYVIEHWKLTISQDVSWGWPIWPVTYLELPRHWKMLFFQVTGKNATCGFLNISKMDHVIETSGKPSSPSVKRRGISILVKLYSWYIRSVGSCKSLPGPTDQSGLDEWSFCLSVELIWSQVFEGPYYLQAPTCPNKKKINPGHLFDLSKNRTYITPEHFGTTLWFAKGLLYWNCESWPPWGNIKDWEWLQIGDPEAWFFN